MEVILLKDVDNVGLRGDVVEVARGYARNFLLPRQLAEPATPAKVGELQKRDAQRARHEAKSFEEAQQLGETLAKLELRFEVKAGPTGSLFGSVTPTDLADELWDKHKVRVDRRKIGTDAIKKIGYYDVPIELFTDVTVDVRAVVSPEGGVLPPEEELRAQEAAEAAAAEEAAQAEAAAAATEQVLVEEPVAPAGETAEDAGAPRTAAEIWDAAEADAASEPPADELPADEPGANEPEPAAAADPDPVDPALADDERA
jgi:large subunit ribosomal protein L9